MSGPTDVCKYPHKPSGAVAGRYLLETSMPIERESDPRETPSLDFAAASDIFSAQTCVDAWSDIARHFCPSASRRMQRLGEHRSSKG